MAFGIVKFGLRVACFKATLEAQLKVAPSRNVHTSKLQSWANWCDVSKHDFSLIWHDYWHYRVSGKKVSLLIELLVLFFQKPCIISNANTWTTAILMFYYVKNCAKHTQHMFLSELTHVCQTLVLFKINIGCGMWDCGYFFLMQRYLIANREVANLERKRWGDSHENSDF